MLQQQITNCAARGSSASDMWVDELTLQQGARFRSGVCVLLRGSHPTTQTLSAGEIADKPDRA